MKKKNKKTTLLKYKTDESQLRDIMVKDVLYFVPILNPEYHKLETDYLSDDKYNHKKVKQYCKI